jgi:hypothetical protein
VREKTLQRRIDSEGEFGSKAFTRKKKKRKKRMGKRVTLKIMN